MSKSKKKPKKKTTQPTVPVYPKDYKASQPFNLKKMPHPNRVQNVKMVQRFTGKRGN